MGLRRFLRRRFWDEERARELDAYLAQETDDNIARGMSPEAARAAAHRKLGNATRIREEIYTMNSVAWLESLWQDLRYGARLLRRNLTFAAVAVLTLALGTGANTAVFQLVDAVRLRSLPVDHPEQLAEVRIVKSPHGRTGMFNGRWPMLSYPLYQKIRERQQVFADIVAWGSNTFDLAQGGEQRPAEGLWVSGNFFSVLGVRAAAGRLLTPADDVPGCAPVAVLGDGFWQREYGASPSAVGSTVLLDGHRFDVIGVAAPAFFGVDVGRAFDVAVPICAEPIVRGTERSGLDKSDVWFLGGIGRLKPGVTLDQAGAHLAGLSKAIQAATLPPRYQPADARDYLEMVIGVRDASGGISGLRRNYADSLNLLMGVTAAVLLIACANLANLMLARATAREREVAVRLAIGASRARIVRQLLSESLLIAALGAAGGLLAAQWFSRSLVAFLSTTGSPVRVDLGLDTRVFGFTLLVAVAACLLFGVAPAIRATATAPLAAIKAGSRGASDSRERFGVRRALVVLQVSLSVVLIVGALLFARSLYNLTSLDGGFRQAGVMTAVLDMRKAGIKRDAQAATNARVIENVRAVPGVAAATQAFMTPVAQDFWNERIEIAGATVKDMVNFNSVGPGYFDALGIRMTAGRDFTAADTPQSPKVAIVSESFVKKYLAGGTALGQSFQVEGAPGDARPAIEIVGVVRDTKYTDLREPFLPLIYLAATQDETPGPGLQLVIRADAPLTAVAPEITAAVGAVHPAISIQYRTLRAQVEQSLLRERLMATLSGFFGVLAVLIATIGLYGVMSFMVTRRRLEIGVRMALGADRVAVVGMIVREAGLLLAGGLAIGLVGAVFAARAAQSLLYDLQPGDPLTLALAALSLVGAAFLASWIPARRAAGLSPTVALREE
jgi:putative ABC transport system permease protein